MVNKTRSHGSLVGMEEMNEVRLELAGMKKDIADLKNLKSEVREVKKLLQELCKQKGTDAGIQRQKEALLVEILKQVQVMLQEPANCEIEVYPGPPSPLLPCLR